MINSIKNILAYTRGVLFFGSIILWYIIIITPWTILCFLTNQKRIYPHIQVPFFKAFFFMFGIKLKVTGSEHIMKGKKFIVLSNHQSFIDIPLIVSLSGHVAFLAKEELFNVPIFGWAIKSSGSLPVSRSNPRKNKGLAQRMKKNIDDGHNFCAFPEGTRSIDTTVAPFKVGIFKYIKDIQHPIVPISICNANSVLHKSSIKFFPGEVEVIIHPSISIETIQTTDIPDLKDMVRDIIESGVNK
ncbi:MAG: 1-acyl-sn-glycerol-3-phosphate acyltransferase [Fibrobacterales bacterium]